MQHNRPILTQHRIQRYILWTLALLSWIAAVLAGRHANARHVAQRGDVSLAWLTHRVANLMMIRAAHIGRLPRCTPKYWRHGRDLRRRHLRRSILGAKLRRVLKHRDLRQHITQLIAVLRNLDAYAAQLAHNIRHRRRVWRIMPPIAEAVAVHGAPASSPALADSS